MGECTAQFGKAHVTPTGNHIVGQRNDGLIVQLVADFGPTQYDAHVGPQDLELAHHLGGLHHVPDVHAKADDGCGECLLRLGCFVIARSQGSRRYKLWRSLGDSVFCVGKRRRPQAGGHGAKHAAIQAPGRICKFFGCHISILHWPNRGQQIRHHLRNRPGQRVLSQHRSRAQISTPMARHIRQQVAQPQRGVDIARVQCGEDDAGVSRHGRIIKACPGSPALVHATPRNF